MELIYTWIQGEKILNNFELNMGWRERFSYDPELNTLTGDEDHDYVENFFSDGVSNITAFVGSNGTGKSTALEFLINALPKGQSQSPIAIIIHFSEEYGKLIIYAHESIAAKLNIQTNSNYELVKTLRNEYDYQDIIYYTNSFYDRIVERDLQGLHNVSLANMLFPPSPGGGAGRRRIGDEFKLRFKFSEYARTIAFLYSNIDKQLEISLPSFLMVSTIFPTEINSEGYYINPENSKIYEEIYDKIVVHYNEKLVVTSSAKEKFLMIVERNLVLEELGLLDLLEINSSLITSLLDSPVMVGDILKGNNKKSEQIMAFVNSLGELIEKDDVSIDGSTAWIDIKKTRNRDIQLIIAKIRSLSNLNSNFIQLGLSHERMELGESSSGELALLSILSRLYSLSGMQQKMANLQIEGSVLILMDEPELYLHPIYQKNVVNYLTELLPQIFAGIKVQVILTSHSPFIISDLPKRNVCFFTGDKSFITSELMEHKQTFAANIHTLLSDSFFLDNGFIGTFAKKKLDQIITDLNTTKDIAPKRREEIRKIIFSIGEPILKRKLLEMFEDKFNNDLEKRISNIENRLGL